MVLWVARAIPVVLAAGAAVALGAWIALMPQSRLEERLPGQDGSDQAKLAQVEVVDLRGQFTPGPGSPATDVTTDWPRFRGPSLDAISTDGTPLARQWPSQRPTQLWSIELGEGYAGAAVHRGRVYLIDYDQTHRADVVRCLSLSDGRDVWRRSYAVDITRNHGISRTIPAVTDQFLVTFGPKCHVLCLDPATGDFKWGIDLVREYGATVPQWYAGQCPLIDGGRVILAPGGPDALLIAVNAADGNVLWKTPNPRKWQMTHSSILPITLHGQKTYVYCASGGVVGVSPDDGRVLWEYPEWKVTMANVPSPVPVGDDRIFLSGGYGAGSLLLQVEKQGDSFVPKPVLKLKPETFGSEQHTPVFHGGHIYGVIPGGQLVCLDLHGRQVWASGSKNRFGLGPYMIADGLIILMNDSGTLSLVEASPAEFKLLAQARVIERAHEAWGPFALVEGRLIGRDLTRMVCLDLRKASYD